jgi:hypothetical protein
MLKTLSGNPAPTTVLRGSVGHAEWALTTKTTRLYSAVDTANKAKAPFSSSEAGGDNSSLVLSNSDEDDGVRQLQSLRPLPLIDLGFRLDFSFK